MHYEEIRPPALLSPWVAAFWQFRGSLQNGAPRFQRVLPDGCVDFLFDFAAHSAAGVLVGPMTRAVLAPLSRQVDVFGIRFHPGVVRSLIRFDAGELRDRVMPLDAIGVTPEFSAPNVSEQISLQTRVGLVMPWIEKRLRSMPAPDATVNFAIEQWTTALAADVALPTVAAVACDVGVSERCLERRFSAWAGYSPALFRRLMRFQAALMVSKAGTRPWAETATRCGYADQSHLSRDFREFAATTAMAWAVEQRPVGNVQDGAVVAA